MALSHSDPATGRPSVIQVASFVVTLVARTITVFVVPYVAWNVDSIYSQSGELRAMKGQLADLKDAVDRQLVELKGAVGGAYRMIDAARDQAATGQRLDGMDRRTDRLEARVDAIQSDLATIQRASAVPLPGERKRQ